MGNSRKGERHIMVEENTVVNEENAPWFKDLKEFKEYYYKAVDDYLDNVKEEDITSYVFFHRDLGEELVNDILEDEEGFEYRGFNLTIDEDMGDTEEFFYIYEEADPLDYPVEETESYELTFKSGAKVVLSASGTREELIEYEKSLIENTDYAKIRRVNYDKIYSPLPEAERDIVNNVKQIIDNRESDNFEAYIVVPSYGNIELITTLLNFEYDGYTLFPTDDPDEAVNEMIYLTFKIEKE